jgi:hypothetical protein
MKKYVRDGFGVPLNLGLINGNGLKQNADKDLDSNKKPAVDYAAENALKVMTKAPKPSTTRPSVNTSDNSNWSYDPFKVSDHTAAADQNRQAIASNKPGDFTYGSYEKSDAVKQAEALLQQQLANKPGAYQSAWQTQLDDTLNKILNREKFSYDLNGDALYQQYKDQYVNQGQQAMMDTMGQVQAMTGGYGNSYAQTVGQQTYQGYLQQLNDKVPELYQLALDQYSREGDDLYNQYGLYADREDQDYGRYRDQMGDYYTELDRLTEDARYQGEQDYGKYMDAYNMAYGQHRDQVGDWQDALNRADADYWNQYNRDYGEYTDNRNLSYEQNRDTIGDQQWQASFDESVRQADRDYDYKVDRDKVSDEQWQKEFDYAMQNVASKDNPVEPDAPDTEDNVVTETEATKSFEAKLSPESNHDAIARATYGPYSAYVAYMLEKADLSEAEQDYLISKYGITSSDRQHLKDKGLI